MLERLKICWYALTKKEYLFCAVNKRIEGNSGTVWYSNCKDTKECHPFLTAVAEYCETIIETEL